jgi:transcriptional regulator with XRE-family HTH domain
MICLEKLNRMKTVAEQEKSANPFGKWLKVKREAKDWSVRKLADKAGNICSASYISQLENNSYVGKKGKPMQPDEIIVDALASALGESVNEARLLAGYAPGELSDDELVADGLFEGYYDLPEEIRPLARKQIAAIIRSLKDEETATNN